MGKTKQTYRAFDNSEVAAVFLAFPDKVKPRLLQLRELIFDTAAATHGVGELEEALRWGEPAYLTSESKIGSMIRLNNRHPAGERYAIFFHCQTNLVETFRQRYPGLGSYEGNRAISFATRDALPADELRPCIAMALTYHRDKHRAAPSPRAGRSKHT